MLLGIAKDVPMANKIAAIIIGVVVSSMSLGFILEGGAGAVIGIFYSIIGILIYFALTVGIQFKYKEIEVSSNVDDTLSHVVKKLRARAMRLKFAARMSLLLILISLIAGISIFIYADNFARADVRVFSMEESEAATQAVADSVVQHWLGNSRDKEKFHQVIRGILETTKDPRTALSKRDEEYYASKIVEAIKPEIIKDFPDELVSKIELEYKKYMDLTTAKLTNSNSTLISSISTRIGAVFILLFLVQVLVSMYRYNTKLSAFYDARADILEITGKLEAVPLEFLSDLLSPDSLDFSKEGKGPADQAVELTKHLLSKSGK